MFEKPFVSIFFSKNYLSIVHANKQGNSVFTNVTIPLPKDVFDGNHVVNPEALGEILSIAWKKYKIRERTVAFVIPERFAFTKVLTVEGTSTEELHESVLLQLSEFLPKPEDEMTIDWKIIDKNEEGFRVFAIAIDKKLLNGFVDAIEYAGLFPVIGEVPSISLTRLLKKNGETFLIIFQDTHEALVVFGEGETPFATSILAGSAEEDILGTVKRVIRRYPENTISRVVLIGGNGTETFLESLSKLANAPLERFNLAVSGIAPAESITSVIAYALQKASIALPNDPTTINLIPSQIVKIYNAQKIRVASWVMILMTTLMVWIPLFSALGVFLFFAQREATLDREIAQQSDVTALRQKAKSDVEKINTTSSKILAIQDRTISVLEVLNNISIARPPGITLSEIKMTVEEGAIRAVGFSESRLSLIEYKQKLEENPNIESVTIPLSSFEQERDIKFSVEILYKIRNAKEGGPVRVRQQQ